MCNECDDNKMGDLIKNNKTDTILLAMILVIIKINKIDIKEFYKKSLQELDNCELVKEINDCGLDIYNESKNGGTK